MNSATTATTIEKLRDAFAKYGLPEVLMLDNATCFTNDEFQKFLKANGIRHANLPHITQPQRSGGTGSPDSETKFEES